MKTILVLGGGIFQFPLVRFLKDEGYRIALVDRDPHVNCATLADVCLKASLQDTDNIIFQLESLNMCDVAAVCSLGVDAAVVSQAILCDRLSLPGIPIEAAVNTTNKFQMKSKLQSADIKTARGAHFSDDVSACQIVDKEIDFEYPLVVKPVASSGSRGVSFVSSSVQLIDAVTRAQNISSGGILIEEFLPGTEYAVDGIMSQGTFLPLCVSKKERSHPPYLHDLKLNMFPVNAHYVPKNLLAVAKSSLQALGVDNSVFHGEFIVDEFGSVSVVEIASRAVGFGLFADAVTRVSGVRCIKLVVDLALGVLPETESVSEMACVLGFPQMQVGKKFISVQVPDLASDERCHIFVPTNSLVGEVLDGPSRHMAILVFGENILLANKRYKNIIENIIINYE